RSFKNPVRIHRATHVVASAFARVVVIDPTTDGRPIAQHRLARGAGQLVVIGTTAGSIQSVGGQVVETAGLDLRAGGRVALRLAASIALAEIARQVGRRRPLQGSRRAAPRYDMAVRLMPLDHVTIEAESLRAF